MTEEDLQAVAEAARDHAADFDYQIDGKDMAETAIAEAALKLGLELSEADLARALLLL